MPPVAGAEEPTASQQWSVHYSPDTPNQQRATKDIRFAESRAVYETSCKMLQPLSNRLSRRYHYTVRGQRMLGGKDIVIIFSDGWE